MVVVDVDEITYTYPATEKPALSKVSLSINQGEFLAIIGNNGAGKSTLCYTIAGYIPHFFRGTLHGSVYIEGVDTKVASLNDIVLKVGLAFQNPFNQISGAKYTVYEEIAFGLENTGVPRQEMIERVDKVLDLTGIQDLADRSPYSLSGGQQQRVALASILVMEPKVLVLDEPTSQLDPVGSREVFEVIKEMSQRGLTVAMVEHKVEWIAQFADRVIALYDGQILLEGKPADVLASPLLEEKGFGLSRYTQVARRASERNLWLADIPLPVTLQDAVDGFGRVPR
jgi:energy-coupling factor transporter ATP-binding protein EcfA2